MSVNAICLKCRSTQKVANQQCGRCGVTFNGKNRKFRVRVMMPEGRCKSKVVKTLKMAQAIESKYVVQKIEGEVFNIQDVPVLDDLWQHYYAWAKVNKVSHKDDYQRYHQHLKPTLGNLKMNAIRPLDIDRILNDMRKGRGRRKRKDNKPYSGSSLMQVYALIRRLYNWANRKGLYEGKNPAKGVTIPRFDNHMNNFLSRQQIHHLLSFVEAFGNERAELVIKYALYSGRRRGDILKLKWKDVDFDNRFVTYQGMNTKNRKTQTLPVNNRCYEVLSRARSMIICPYVFPASTGRYYHSFDATWQRIRKAAGFSYRFHDLRHTFASYLASSGKVDIYTLQTLLGHKDIAMTMRYASLFPGALRKGADVANTVFEAQDVEQGSVSAVG